LGYQLHSIFKQLLYTHIQVDNITWRNPLAFLLPPCHFPFASFLFPFTYLETLLAVIGSRPPWSQVIRKLTSPFLTPPHSLPIPSPFQIPSTQVNCAPYYDDFMNPASHGPEQYYQLHNSITITSFN
jgi:hypothetical protein